MPQFSRRSNTILNLAEKASQFAFLALLALMAFRRVEGTGGNCHFGLSGRGLKLVLAAGLVWLVCLALRRQLSALRTSLDVPLLLLVVVAGLSDVWSPVAAPGYRRDLIYFCGEVLFFFCLVSIIRRSPSSLWRPRVLIWVVLLSGAAAVVVGIPMTPGLSGVFHGQRMLRLALTPMGNPNRLGMLLASLLPLALTLAWARHRWWGYCWRIPTVLVLVLGLALTYSRGCWIGALAGLLFSSSLAGNKRFWLQLAATGLAVLLLAHCLPGAVSRARAAFKDGGAHIPARVVFWQGALDVIGDHPLLGVGYGVENSRTAQKLAFRLHYKDSPGIQAPPPAHAHNVVLERLVQVGALGLLTYLWILSVSFRHLWRVHARSSDPRERVLARAVLGALVGLLVAGMFDAPLVHSRIALTFWMLLAVAEILRENLASQLQG